MAEIDLKRLAGKAIGMHAESRDGLSPEQAGKLRGLSEGCQRALPKALEKGARGLLTEEKKTSLERAGCPKAFVRELAGPDGARALTARAKRLGEALSYRSFEERMKALEELSDMGPHAHSALSGLRYALKRCSRIDQLVNAGMGGRSERLAVSQSDVEDLFVCAAAAGPLGRMGQAASSELVQARTARRTLIRTGLVDAQLMASLRDELLDRNAPIVERRAAASSLAQIGEPAEPTLVEVLSRSSDDMARQAASSLLGARGKERAAVALRPIFLWGARPELQSAAMGILVQIAQRIGRPAIAIFEEGLRSKKPETRIHSITALSEIGAAALPGLLAATKHDDRDVRLLAARALGRYRTMQSMDALEKMADDDPDPRCKAAAQKALGALRREPAKK
jgi:HEAT repeats